VILSRYPVHTKEAFQRRSETPRPQGLRRNPLRIRFRMRPRLALTPMVPLLDQAKKRVSRLSNVEVRGTFDSEIPATCGFQRGSKGYQVSASSVMRGASPRSDTTKLLR